MEYLCIDKLSLDNAEFLLNMPNLKHLVLKSGSGEHLSYLKNLSRIEQLELSGNPIAVSELPEMPFLWNLNCELAAQTELDDLTRFPSLTCLTANLSLLNNGPVDVAPMGQLMQLEELHIAGFMDLNIKGVEAVLNLPKLRELSIRCSTYGYRSVMLDPALLKEECSLEKLFLKRCQFVNLQTSETDWTCFSHLTNLRDATLFLCKLEDICFLSGLPKLEILDLEKNSISDFSPLLQCPALKTVYTWGNPQLEPQLPKTVEIIPHETLDDFFS